MSKFLNLDAPTPESKADPSSERPNPGIGGGLKKKTKTLRKPADKSAVARAGQIHGYTRSTAPERPSERVSEAPRRGRPPLNETMSYWRIYIAPDLRDELNALRDAEGRRLNDVLRDMLVAYKSGKT